MEKSIQLKTVDLNAPLIEGLKKYFNSINAKEITISFSTPKKTRLRHETREEANKRIEKAILSIENENSVFFTAEEFENVSSALLKIK